MLGFIAFNPAYCAEAGHKNSLNGHGKVQSVAHTHCVNCIPIYQAYFVLHGKREVFEFRC